MIAKRLTMLLFVAMLAVSVAAPGALAKHHGRSTPPAPHNHITHTH